MRTPVWFISHGSPMIALSGGPAADFLSGLGPAFGTPRAVLVVSAHWEAERPVVSDAAAPETIHDFGGFPAALQAIRHAAPGAPDVAREVAAALAAAGWQPALAARGLDHGAWIPMRLIDPGARLPVLQLSILHRAGAGAHYRLGQALAGLRERGILILGSGSATHNLHEFFRGGWAPDSPSPDWATGFADWIADRVAAGDIPALIDYRRRAPHAARNHPTEEHLMPLLVALGAAAGDPGRRVHASHNHGILHMDAYRFGG
jgi:4,5-DOPA dioxygenase extradiol